MESKVCTKCGETKPLSEFHRDKSKKDGHAPHCKVCDLAQQAEYHKRVAAERVEPSPTDTKTCTGCEETKPLSEFYKRSASPDGLQPCCKSCVKAERKAHYAANREKIAASVKAYREANRERIAAYNKAYQAEKWANDPEYRAQLAAAGIRRRRLLASAVQEPYTREEIFERDGWICQLCQEPIDSGLKWPDSGFASIDHIVPISLGGDDTPGNVQAAHFGCNSSKKARIPENGVQPGLF